MRRSAKTLMITAAAAGGAIALERLLLAAPRYRGPRSDHFDGHRFQNTEPVRKREESFLKWRLTRKPGTWRDRFDVPFGDPPPARVGEGDLRVTFINHATTLLQLDGVNILTDPVWSERVSPVSFVGPRRHRPPGIRFEDLPAIDYVLVSHNHYDHLNVETLRRLQQRDRPRIVVPLGNVALLERHGIGSATELDWWGSEGNVTAVPSRHFSARGISDRNRTLWCGFVIASAAGNVYFAGDTGWGPHFQQIGDRFPPIRLALLPIGAYLPRWFMEAVHIDPAQAVDAHVALRAETSIAIHFGTFALGDDGDEEPTWDLKQAIASKQPPPRFWILEHGEGRDIPSIDRSGRGRTASSTT
jgi:L-ascorbate metabolism protein UlaG (beta-lactamase superfamily)